MNKIRLVTAADSDYFCTLISLIQTLKFQLSKKTVEIALDIWDIGLSNKQIELISLIDFNIRIRNFNQIPSPFDGAFSPKNKCYAWKSYAMLNSYKESTETLGWIDAGSALSGNLDKVLNEVSLNGSLFLTHEHTLHGDYTSDLAISILGMSIEMLRKRQVISTFFILERSSISEEILEEWVQLSSNEELIKSDQENHRHDQSLLSYIVFRRNILTNEASDYLWENGTDIKKAHKKGYLILAHRRKWHYVNLNAIINIWNL